MQRSLKTWWGAWYVRPQYLQRKNIEKEQCTNLIATGGRVFISPWSFQTKKDSFRSTGLLARCLTDNLLHRNKGWVCPNVGCTNSTPHVLSDPNLGADSDRWVRFAFSAMLIVHVSNFPVTTTTRSVSNYKDWPQVLTRALMLQWTWHKTHVAIQLQLQLLLVPKKPHWENFNDMVRLDIQTLYTSLWEFFARKILWKYTPDCTRAYFLRGQWEYI